MADMSCCKLGQGLLELWELISFRSWKTTYIGLTQLENSPVDDTLAKHLADSQTLDLIKRALHPDPRPSSDSKAIFDTKTSAINTVASAQGGQDDIKQIRDDALWLSGEGKLDEVSSLRLVVLERQTRPGVQLQELSLTDDLPKAGGSFNGSRFQPALSASRSVLLAKPSTNGDSSTNHPNQVDVRRSRLFSIYLAERQYRIKTCRHLVLSALLGARDDDNPASGGSTTAPDWTGKIGKEILSAWNISGECEISGGNILVDGIDAIRSRIRGLESGCGWFADKHPREPVEAAWCESQVIDLVTILEIILALFGSLPQLSRSDAVLSWFKLMSDYGFFEAFEPVSNIPDLL
ncbi:MAG: hypothetical protein Q9174_001047 [Haloplaca sp. 1 TL-2023]